jgi:FlaA1/EpsC-like NDP-sugar epimerase
VTGGREASLRWIVSNLRLGRDWTADLARRLARAERYALILSFDALAAVLALGLAMWLRFDGSVPAQYAGTLPLGLFLIAGSRVLCNFGARLHFWSFRLAGLGDALRVGVAAVAGTALFALSWNRVFGFGVPRSVYLLELFISTTAFLGLRFLPRAAIRWVGRWRQAMRGAPRTIIVGAGDVGELLARELHRSAGSPYRLVGFVDEDPKMVGWRIDGSRVLGTVRELPAVLRRHRVETVLLADPRQPASRTREILKMCASCRARFKIIPASPALRGERPSVSMLDDLSPGDLLPRDTVPFDEVEIEALVRGRRILVTGAAGSIGGELCRQLARHRVGELVMVDMNENELYLLARALQEEHPGVRVAVEVANVREIEPLLRLGVRHRPQDVFHAAAHKHVPLMEVAPHEAVKNNVFGTLHAARMAVSCGAERFVLISTDKAVKPTSVMGATKRVAELIVRALARSSRTHMTAVRFGNVLGSAGSVVPLFKRQIARGGPVTVTHPECMRYFMTIQEAVGLVLLAGLGRYGELCVLEMGEPIRVVDLARSMITLAGRVPGEEIEIVYTGLRPGEKLSEQVLTEEEESSLVVRNRIRVTRSPSPPPLDLAEGLERLRRVADQGDRGAVLDMLRQLVPSYRSEAGPAPGGSAAEAVRSPERPWGGGAVVAELTEGGRQTSRP